MLIYTGLISPLETKLRNRLELFNEACIDLSCIHLFVFTDWVGIDEQYQMGWSLFYLLVICIFVNSSFVLFYGVKNIYLIALKYGRIMVFKTKRWKKYWFTVDESKLKYEDDLI